MNILKYMMLYYITLYNGGWCDAQADGRAAPAPARERAHACGHAAHGGIARAAREGAHVFAARRRPRQVCESGADVTPPVRSDARRARAGDGQATSTRRSVSGGASWDVHLLRKAFAETTN